MRENKVYLINEKYKDLGFHPQPGFIKYKLQQPLFDF